MTDLAAVSARMVDLENGIPGADPRADVPVYEVLAMIAGIDPATPGLGEAIQREVARARELARAYYGPSMHKDGDHPAVLGAVSFLQGVTFARAARDIEGDGLRAYLDDAITKWREKKASEDAAGGGLDAHTAACYVDAFQSVRVSILGELLA